MSRRRKDEHIAIAKMAKIRKNDFSHIRFIHHSIPCLLYTSIVAPVNLFLQGTFVANHKTTIIEDGVAYPYQTLLENGCPHQLKNTVTTITFFNEYLALKNIPLQQFEYTIENNLISDEQVKFGLGSSAASVVLTLKLLNRLYRTNLSPLVLFKMAVLKMCIRDRHYASCNDV